MPHSPVAGETGAGADCYSCDRTSVLDMLPRRELPRRELIGLDEHWRVAHARTRPPTASARASSAVCTPRRPRR